MTGIEYFIFNFYFRNAIISLFLSIGSLITYIKVKKTNKKVKSNKVVKLKKIKSAKFSLIFTSILFLISVGSVTYYGLDVIKKDYQESAGTFSYVFKERWHPNVHFDIEGEDKHYTSNRSLYESLEEGKKYKIIYGKRTEFIVECIPIE